MTSTQAIEDLIALARYRWAIPLLTMIAARGGARFIELLHGMNISRESLSRTLDGARAAGWVVRNPGHGHPLRPEYILSAEGKRLAQKASIIDAAQATLNLKPEKMTRWGLPIVRSIADGNQRFNDLARALVPAGPRALSQGLRSLSAQQIVTRELSDGYPPYSRYSLTGNGWILAQAA